MPGEQCCDFPTYHEWLRHTFVLTAKRKKPSKSEAKGTVSKVTGKKITKIIGLGKKKPSTDEQTSSAEEDVPTCGKTLSCVSRPSLGMLWGCLNCRQQFQPLAIEESPGACDALTMLLSREMFSVK